MLAIDSQIEIISSFDRQAKSIKLGEPASMHVFNVVFSPDGSLLASCKPAGVEVWSLSEQDIVHTLRHKEQVITAVFTANNEQLITLTGGFSETRIIIWNLTGDKAKQWKSARLQALKTRIYLHDDQIWVAASAADALDVEGGDDYHNGASPIEIFDLKDPKRTLSTKVKGLSLQLSSEAALAVTIVNEVLTVWDLTTETKVRTLPDRCHEEEAPDYTKFKLARNGQKLAVLTSEGIRIYNCATWKVIATIPIKSDHDLVEHLVFDHDANLVAFKAGQREKFFDERNKKVFVHDANTGALVHQIPLGETFLADMIFSPPPVAVLM